MVELGSDLIEFGEQLLGRAAGAATWLRCSGQWAAVFGLIGVGRWFGFGVGAVLLDGGAQRCLGSEGI